MWRPTLHTDAHDRAARRAAQAVTIAATIVFALIVCRWRPWDLFQRTGFSNDFYDEQARSLLRGRLAVRPEVAGHEGFLIDGNTYLYYGPFLAIARLPFALFGDFFAQRLTRLSMIAGFVVYCTGAFHLIDVARRWASTRWHLPIASVASPWRTGAFVAAAACSPVLFLSGWVSVYHETELWAAAFAVWSAVCVLRWVETPSRRAAIVTAAVVVAAILTRAPVGLGAAAGAGLVALTRWRRDRAGTMIVIVGSACGVVVHSAINWAKFGSPTALPAERQVLSLQDPERLAWFAGNHDSFFSLRFLPTTLVHYLRPDTVRFERLVPFVRFGPLARDRGSYPVESITPSSSLTATATLLCLAALVGLIVMARRRDVVWLALTFGAVIAAVPTFAIGFIANRYLVDMMPLLLIPAALALATVTVPTTAARLRTAARAAVIALLVWALWSNAALATWTQNLKEPGFTTLRYRVDDLIFGDPAPSLVVLDPNAPVPRDGTVGLALSPADERCEAVYIAEQGRWVDLERLDGSRQLTGTIELRPDSTTSVVGGDTWNVSIVVADSTARAVLDDGGVTTEGEAIADVGDIATDATAVIRVIDDDILGQFIVTVNGVTSVFRFGTLPGPMLPSGDLHLLADDPTDETLCHVLERRR